MKRGKSSTPVQRAGPTSASAWEARAAQTQHSLHHATLLRAGAALARRHRALRVALHTRPERGRDADVRQRRGVPSGVKREVERERKRRLRLQRR